MTTEQEIAQINKQIGQKIGNNTNPTNMPLANRPSEQLTNSQLQNFVKKLPDPNDRSQVINNSDIKDYTSTLTDYGIVALGGVPLAIVSFAYGTTDNPVVKYIKEGVETVKSNPQLLLDAAWTVGKFAGDFLPINPLAIYECIKNGDWTGLATELAISAGIIAFGLVTGGVGFAGTGLIKGLLKNGIKTVAKEALEVGAKELVKDFLKAEVKEGLKVASKEIGENAFKNLSKEVTEKISKDFIKCAEGKLTKNELLTTVYNEVKGSVSKQSEEVFTKLLKEHGLQDLAEKHAFEVLKKSNISKNLTKTEKEALVKEIEEQFYKEFKDTIFNELSKDFERGFKEGFKDFSKQLLKNAEGKGSTELKEILIKEVEETALKAGKEGFEEGFEKAAKKVLREGIERAVERYMKERTYIPHTSEEEKKKKKPEVKKATEEKEDAAQLALKKKKTNVTANFKGKWGKKKDDKRNDNGEAANFTGQINNDENA